MAESKRSKPARYVRAAFVSLILVLPLWVVAQVVPDPPGSPVLSSELDWLIFDQLVSDPAFALVSEACFAVGPCFGRMTCEDDGSSRRCGGRWNFRSPFGQLSTLLFSYVNRSLPINPSVDQFKFRMTSGNDTVADSNVVIWGLESYQFLRHVLGVRPGRLIDPLRAGFELKRIVCLPDTSASAQASQQLLVLKYVGPSTGFLVTVRAEAFPTGFGPLTIE